MLNYATEINAKKVISDVFTSVKIGQSDQQFMVRVQRFNHILSRLIDV